MIKRRIIQVDWAKSICMFLVVFGHCHIQPSLQLISQVIYSFHIPLFFQDYFAPRVFLNPQYRKILNIIGVR